MWKWTVCIELFYTRKTDLFKKLLTCIRKKEPVTVMQLVNQMQNVKLTLNFPHIVDYCKWIKEMFYFTRCDKLIFNQYNLKMDYIICFYEMMCGKVNCTNYYNILFVPLNFILLFSWTFVTIFFHRKKFNMIVFVVIK